MDLNIAIARLRAGCNLEIKRINSTACQETPEEVSIPPIPFGRVNEILKLCDAVFHAYAADVPEVLQETVANR